LRFDPLELRKKMTAEPPDRSKKDEKRGFWRRLFSRG
jgi:hypothetical protein